MKKLFKVHIDAYHAKRFFSVLILLDLDNGELMRKAHATEIILNSISDPTYLE